MELDIVSMALNLMMSDYDDNGNINLSSEQFPTTLVFEALVRAKNNIDAVKNEHKNLLLRTIVAMERELYIDETVVRCTIHGLDESIMEELI